MAKNQVTLTFAADSASLESAMSRVRGSTDQTSSRFQRFARVGRVAAVATFAALGLAAKVGFQELQDGQKVAAQTAAVIKSTGGAANVTAKDVDTLAGSLMRKSGVDDELIASGQNVLLTFTKVRNEAGKGNDVFTQATKSALDMSVALGTDLKGANILVGKALNDPIKGITSLTRSGVQFTEGQKASIKAMVESGNTMGAQKVILKELETQFGGSAEAAGGTLAGQLNVARETFNNLAGNIVGAVLPAFNGFAGVLNTVLGWLSAHQTTTKVLVGILATLAGAVLAVNAITKVYAATQAILNVVLAANPIGAVILLIAGLVAGLILAYKNSETFRNIVRGAMEVVKTAVNAVVEAVKDVVSAVIAAKDHPAVKAIQTVFTTYFGAAKTAVSGLINTVEAIIGAVRAVVNSDAVGNIKGAFERGFGAAKAAVDAVASAAGNAIAVVQGVIDKINQIAGAIRSLPSLPSLGGIAGGAKNLLTADGGVFNGAQLRIIGEAGPEAVIPLSRPERARQLIAATGLGGGGSGVTVQNMNVYEREDVYRVASQLGRQLSMGA